MSTVANLEVKQLQDHIAASGLMGAFTDILGNAQPASKFQAYELNLTDTPPIDRVIMIRETGAINGANRYLHKERPMLVLVVSRANVNDSVIARGLASDIEQYLTTNFSSGCIFNINTSGVTGPFPLPDGRRAYEINLTVMFNI